MDEAVISMQATPETIGIDDQYGFRLFYVTFDGYFLMKSQPEPSQFRMTLMTEGHADNL
jgi:hypothetical protein